MVSTNMAKATMQFFPIVLYHTMSYALILLGVYALIEDEQVANDVCGKAYHLYKFTALNMVNWVFATVSYCLWKGGGEGARARALVLSILYFAFFVWGFLLWQHLSANCREVFEKKFKVIYVFHHACTLMNGLAAAMFGVHELWLGKYVGADLTIMAEVHHRMNPIYLPDRTNGGSTTTVDQGFPAPMNGAKSPPGTAGDLNPTLTYEYEKIMQNNTSSSSTLPQTTP